MLLSSQLQPRPRRPEPCPQCPLGLRGCAGPLSAVEPRDSEPSRELALRVHFSKARKALNAHMGFQRSLASSLQKKAGGSGGWAGCVHSERSSWAGGGHHHLPRPQTSPPMWADLLDVSWTITGSGVPSSMCVGGKEGSRREWRREYDKPYRRSSGRSESMDHSTAGPWKAWDWETCVTWATSWGLHHSTLQG